jgi:DNA-binding MarR family transcriptional regulator
MDLERLDVASLAALSGDAAARHVLARLDAAGHGAVRNAHGYVFQRLLAGDPTIGELAEALGITQQGASKHVADLERLGYAERVPDPSDQRVRRVRLTAAGHAAIDAGRAARGALERTLEERFGADDLAVARRVLVGLLDVTGETPLVHGRAMPLPEA